MLQHRRAGADALLASSMANFFVHHALTFALTPIIARAFPEYPRWAYYAVSGALLLVLLFLPRFGFYAVFLAPIWR